MTLPASGAISLSQVNTELGLSSTAQISLNDSGVRGLFGKASGAISISDGYGKANQFAFTVAGGTNVDLRTAAISAGWNGASKVVATINSGVYVYSASTGSPALTVSGSFPNGVQLINNGIIIGRGGDGGKGSDISNYPVNDGSPGGGGGTGLYAAVAMSVTNNGTISGGGGGGGGNGSSRFQSKGTATYSGGGGGGGIGNSNGGAPGYAAGGNSNYSGASGTGGTLTTTGVGGVGGRGAGYGSGGVGGSYGSGGAAGDVGYNYLNGGNSNGGAGGAAGSCTIGNGNITWLATGTRYGPLN